MSIRSGLVSTLAAAALLIAAAAPVAAQPQSPDQQKCLNALNKDGAAVAKAQGLENVGCIKAGGLGKLVGTAQACLTADSKNKVGKKKAKTGSDLTKFCGGAAEPDYGFTSALTVNTAAGDAEVDLVAEVFGADLDAGLASCSSNKSDCLCQQRAAKAIEGVMAAKFGEFVKCKKASLKAPTSESVGDIVDCVSNAGKAGSVAADSKGKIDKKLGVLASTLTKFCGDEGDALPGDCSGETASALVACLDARIECQVCLAIKGMDDLDDLDCDLFDDANGSNMSCVFEEPPPMGGIVLDGALPPTTGRFNYAMTLGIPGADAFCETNFPATHACSYAELQAAETAGDLVGLQDTNGTNVTGFWAIDSTHANTLQCGVSIPWDYQTAHTGQFAEKVSLNNGTGALGSLQSGQPQGALCLQSSWVGCCKD